MKIFILGVLALATLIGTEGCTKSSIPIYKGNARPSSVATLNAAEAEELALQAYTVEAATGQRMPLYVAENAWLRTPTVQ